MPLYQTGDMWSAYEQADWFCITTNATIRHDGQLVMGRGIAVEAAQRFPELPFLLGESVLSYVVEYPNQPYGILLVPQYKIIAVQVKDAWHQPARLALIQHALAKLGRFALAHPDQALHLNYPGIGYGGLPKSTVAGLVALLPPNITVWERA